MSDNMKNLMGYLQRESLKVADQGDNHLLLRFSGEHGDQRMLLHLEGNLLQSFVFPAIKVAEGSRPDIAVAITRANYGLKLGKFELDMNDGELRYQVALPFDGDLPSDKVLDRVVYTGLQAMNRYMPAFLSVIYGNESVKDAVALAERA